MFDLQLYELLYNDSLILLKIQLDNRKFLLLKVNSYEMPTYNHIMAMRPRPTISVLSSTFGIITFEYPAKIHLSNVTDNV